MEQLYREIGRTLRERRETAGLTQGDVAVRVGLSRTSITNIEKGRQHVTLHVLYALADAIGTKPSDLLPDSAALLQRSTELEKTLQKMSLPEEEKAWIQRLVTKTKA
jgi:transcriptional regulator with XRE-family HTH domain